MRSTKRANAPSSPIASPSSAQSNLDNQNCESFEPHLSYLTDGSSVLDLDPTCCIPLFMLRGRKDNAVMRLASILNGDGVEFCKEVSLTGMVSGSPTSIVVPLVGELSILLQQYVEQSFDNTEESKEFMNKHTKWYGIIDGCQVHAAILDLRAVLPSKWGTVMWKVFCVLPGKELDEYRKLAVVQNERNKHIYHYEPTLYEVLVSLRRIYDRLFAAQLKKCRLGTRGVNVHHRDVAHIYDGGDHERNTTIRHNVSVASRLSLRTIDAIGEVANMTCEDIILTSSALNSHKLTNRASALRTYDCRLFKRLFCASTLRGARLFMNALKDNEEDAQVNTVHRVRHWSDKNEYRPAKPAVINDQYDLAKLALYEEAKFLTEIGKREWPDKLDTVRENLLRSTAYDQELLTNESNTTDVIPKVWNAFKICYPALAIVIAKSLSENTPGSNSSASSNEEEPPPPPDDQSNELDESEEDAKRRAAEEEQIKEDARRAALRATGDHHLSFSGISVHALHFDDYATDVVTSKSKRVDLVLSALPETIELATLRQLPAFCKAVLKTGSYIFLFVTENQFSDFYKIFNEQGFKVCEHAFHVQYDSASLRKRRSGNEDFPQRCSEIALIAKTHGQHPTEFSPEFNSRSASNAEECSTGMFAALSKVAPCDDKLKMPKHNNPLFPNERGVDLFCRICRLLTPTEGTCIDPFAGALTTGLACLKTGRKCILIDRDSDALKLATGRLRVYATPRVTMASLEDFTDPITFRKEGSSQSNAVPTTTSEDRSRKRQRMRGDDNQHTNPTDVSDQLERETAEPQETTSSFTTAQEFLVEPTALTPPQSSEAEVGNTEEETQESIGVDALLSFAGGK